MNLVILTPQVVTEILLRNGGRQKSLHSKLFFKISLLSQYNEYAKCWATGKSGFGSQEG
jgi:hypothetical protein